MPEWIQRLIDLGEITRTRRGPGDPLVAPPPPPLRGWMKGLAGMWIANFAAFVLVAAYLGGDALNGHVSDGHYYLASHGHLTEVSRSVYEYSKWHAWSVILSFAVVLPLASLFARKRA